MWKETFDTAFVEAYESSYFVSWPNELVCQISYHLISTLNGGEAAWRGIW